MNDDETTKPDAVRPDDIHCEQGESSTSLGSVEAGEAEKVAPREVHGNHSIVVLVGCECGKHIVNPDPKAITVALNGGSLVHLCDSCGVQNITRRPDSAPQFVSTPAGNRHQRRAAAKIVTP